MRSTSLVCIGLLCLARLAVAQDLLEQVPASIPGHDARFGVPLLARAQDRMRQIGIDLGSVTLRPSAELGVGYDSNVRGEARGRGSGFAATAASLGAVREGRGVVLAGALRADDRRYVSMPAQSRTNWSASAGTSAELGGGQLRLAASHLVLHQERTDLDSLPSDHPIAYTVEHARASYAYRVNRLSLVPNAEFTIYRFATTTIAGFPVSQLYRDRLVARAGLGGRYELSGGHGVIFALGGATTRYRHVLAGSPSRDSTDGLALVGLDANTQNPHAGPWRYSVLAGAQTRHFAAPGRPARTVPVADAQLHWQPTGLTGLSLRLMRAIEDVAQQDQSATLTRARLVLEHEYARDLVFQLSGGVQLAEYSSGRTGVSFNAGARVSWIINDYLRATLSYDFAPWRKGVLDLGPQDGMRLRNVVLASLRLAP